jgi:radical SAM-linked protein
MAAFKETGETNGSTFARSWVKKPRLARVSTFQRMATAPAGLYRLRVRFSRGEELKYISHLDLMRLWERALRRARIPLAYSEGFSPHPRLSIAAPLALGVTSEAELMDIFLERPMPPPLILKAVPPHLPRGIELLEVQIIAPGAPSLQSQVRYALYEVQVATEKDEKALLDLLDSFLAKETVPWQHVRDTGVRHYDLRALVDDLWLVSRRRGNCILGLKLRLDSQGAGRPEQVTAALGFASRPISIHRIRLVLASEESKNVR